MNTLLQVPNLKKRLQCVLFKLSFDENFVYFNRSLDFVKMAIAAVNSNPQLMELIAMLLKVGNYLN